MIDWPIVALALGVGALALGFRWLQTSARRVESLAAVETRVRKLEALLPESERPVPVLPRGLPRGIRG